MPKHLKTKIIDALEASCATFVSLPPSATPHAPTVRYLTFCEGINTVRQAIGSYADGRRLRKRIVVRPSRHRQGLHELYTYHFPKTWSAACVTNRQLIKTAQQIAHSIERDHSLQALEWRVRFLHQLYTLPVWYKDMQNVPVARRRYPHFYSYVFTTVYYSLRAATRTEAVTAPDVTFEPITSTKYEKNAPALAYVQKNEYLCTRFAHSNHLLIHLLKYEKDSFFACSDHAYDYSLHYQTTDYRYRPRQSGHHGGSSE